MPTKSRRSFGRRAKATRAIDRPFEAGLLRQAEKIAGAYRFVLERHDDVGFIGSSVEMPTVFADGPTPDACVAAVHTALGYAVATMLEQGQSPPAPASTGARNVQVNVRLTADEKFLLQETARRLGFKGVSDFVRNAALDRTHAA